LQRTCENLEIPALSPTIPVVEHALDAPAIVEFGRFRVVPHRRELLAEGRPVRLGGRDFDLLMALLEVPGAVVSKDELMDRVWARRIVEENRLQGAISALRKALGVDRDLIRTVAGRGYQFTGKLRVRSEYASEQVTPGPTVTSARPVRALTNLREPVSELIGREADLAEVTDLVTTQRLVTLIGEGGIGKTRLGVEVVRHLLAEFPDGVWVTELAPLSDPELVPATVATALGLELAAGAMSTAHVANALGTKQLMLVLDNCEHVIAAAAGMAEAILHASSAIRVLATSREPLRIEGECLYRVPPLAVPAEDTENAEGLLRHGAVRLFAARARAADPHFSLGRRNAAVVAGICRRLDGIPLAIELAAARGGVLGIREIADRLDDRFNLLTGGRRTALSRHQTLRATFDWSHDLLTEPERVVLHRLAVFAGAFSLTAATTVAASAEIAATDVVDGTANLVTKSLVRGNVGEEPAQYRLLETTRAYALEKLSASAELDAIARRHAEYYLDLFERAEAESETRPAADWLADYGCHIDNVRAALDWAVSPGGDAFLGVALTAASVPLWLHLSMLSECRVRVDRALSTVEPASGRNARLQMKLHAALGLSLMELEGPRAADPVWTKTLGFAESLDDTEYQLRALRGLWNCRFNTGDCRTTVPLVQRFCDLAARSADPADRWIGDRMMYALAHHRGDQAQARKYIERVRDRYIAPARRSHTLRFQFDHQVVASVSLARILWLQGFPDRRYRLSEAVSIRCSRSIIRCRCATRWRIRFARLRSSSVICRWRSAPWRYCWTNPQDVG
jgi:predicted ATPase/DNA-binding winged helix-turn-helix (wHTH) protein